MVEEAGRDDHPALRIDHEVVPLPDALVDVEIAELELCLAALRERGRPIGAAGGANAVLGALAVRVEFREDLAVIARDGAEIAMGDIAQALSFPPFLRLFEL